MALDPELLKLLLDTFKTELDEEAQVIIDGLLTLENGDEKEKIKTIEVMFRSAHNVKGTARGLSITNISEIAHKLESLFSMIQSGKQVLSSDVIDICLDAVDKMRLCLKCYLDNKAIDFDLAELLLKLEQGVVELPVNTNILTGKPDRQHHHEHAKHDHVKDEDQHHEMDVGATTIETVRVPIDKIDKVSALMEEIQVNKISSDDQFTELTELNIMTKQFMQVWKQISLMMKNHSPSEYDDNLQKLYLSGNDYMIEINQIATRLHKNMRSQLNELSILSNSVQEEVRTLRLIPAANLLCTLPRYVRDLSHQLNKQVELKVVDDGVKMDKFVLEGLKDPIIHILRNAVDHGIESPEERKKKGKSPTGHVTLDIKEEGNLIVINIKDDGAGIDVNKIIEIAEQKNIVTKDEITLMTENEKLDLIFRSGFSTKDIITDISGRGVGLNVVKENINDLKGQVTVTSESDPGTTFSLRVPISLSSERGLLVKAGEELFIVPSTSVERVMIINQSEIVDIAGAQAVVVDQRAIPLRSLADVLGLQSEIVIGKKVAIVILKKGWQVIALLVSEVVGEREIVIKRLCAPLANVVGVSGGTLLERNQVVPVLNPGDVLNLALQVKTINRVTLRADSAKQIARPRILVVDDSITTRTLEKNILENKNYDVTVAVNGQEAWDILQKQTFSLLITDVSMPVMDGFTLTENVRKSDKLQQLPVIIVTSLGSDAEKSRGAAVGANAYIVKNEFESGALLEIVEQLV